MYTFSGCRGWINGRWRMEGGEGGGVSLPKLHPLLRAAFTPLPPTLPPTLSLFHTQQKSGCCFVLLHKHSHRKGAENHLPPFTYYPPPPLPRLPPQRLLWGRKGYPASLSPSLPLPPPNFTQPHTHTENEHRRTYKLNSPGQQLYMR